MTSTLRLKQFQRVISLKIVRPYSNLKRKQIKPYDRFVSKKYILFNSHPAGLNMKYSNTRFHKPSSLELQRADCGLRTSENRSLWPDHVQALTVSASLFRVPRRAVLSLSYWRANGKKNNPLTWPERWILSSEKKKNPHKRLSPHRHGSELEAFFFFTISPSVRWTAVSAQSVCIKGQLYLWEGEIKMITEKYFK